ncbi:MAG: ATP-binding protein [Candidatus Omnitrophota bacterium]
MKYIDRTIRENIESRLFEGKIIIIYGARQVGKTTLVKKIQDKYEASIYLNCDEIDVRQALQNKTSTELKEALGSARLVIIDEAQRVENIGVTLKLLVDNYRDIQIIATGSSSFELSNKIKEPLTGRKYEYYLFPLALEELKSVYNNMEIDRILESRMIYGMYPDIIKTNDITLLKSLADSYLYKDILQFQNIKNPEILLRLLQALALRIGKEVSYNELACLAGVDKNTVANYMSILEKAFIIFRLQPFSRNLRNELKKMRKIYFYDLGIRNALINNFNPLNIRTDAGDIFENYMIVERVKYNRNNNVDKNIFFWRTHQQKEIDYIEEGSGKINGYEFKLNRSKYTAPQEFLSAYENSRIEVINRDTYRKFVGL